MFSDDEGNGPAVTVGRLSGPPLSRRQFMQIAGVAGIAAAALDLGLRDGYAFAAGSGGTSSLGSGTVPEQIHLTWGANPATEVTVSWASPQPEVTPQVTLSPAVGGQTVFGATSLSYTDGLSGEVVNCYHVPLTGLAPATTYSYTVADAATPGVTFSSTFTTTNTGRFAFAFTSFGDLGTPGAGATYTLANGTTISSTTYSESQWNAYNAVGEVEVLTPLFHLLNGDLCYGDKVTVSAAGATTSGSAGVQPAPEVWRDFALNMQRSAANRPWMPCIGNHEAELDNGTYGYNSYTTRFKLPSNGTGFPGSFYSFQVGSVLFISLDANDVCYQGAGAYNVGFIATTDAEGNPIPAADHVYNQFYTGTFTSNSNGTLSPGGTTPNAQTQWLQSTLAAARASTTVDWIVVQMHQSALSSSSDNGCDAGIRQAWVPLFDQYQVDLVLNGHDHDYERSYPVRGFAPSPYPGTSTWKGTANTGWPSNYIYNTSGQTYLAPNSGAVVNTFTPVVATGEGTGLSPSSPFNTTLGTVYMVLGGGGTDKRDNTYLSGTANVTTFTQIRVGAVLGSSGDPNGTIAAGTKPLPDASEPCNWSAVKDTTDAYGIALFSVNPGVQGGNTTMTVTYYHAPTQTSGTPNYSVYDTFYLTRPRSDNPPAATPEFPMPAYVVGGTVALAGGALLVQQHRQTKKAERLAELPELSAPAQG
jgi:alkaline phosphatase D